jgi:hypothetical protein
MCTHLAVFIMTSLVIQADSSSAVFTDQKTRCNLVVHVQTLLLLQEFVLPFVVLQENFLLVFAWGLGMWVRH